MKSKVLQADKSFYWLRRATGNSNDCLTNTYESVSFKQFSALVDKLLYYYAACLK